jgi:hypothetical protein
MEVLDTMALILYDNDGLDLFHLMDGETPFADPG